MPEIGEKFYRSTLVSPDVAPGNDGGGEEYMAKVKTPTSTMRSDYFWSQILVLPPVDLYLISENSIWKIKCDELYF